MNRTATANGSAQAPAARAKTDLMPRTKYPEIFGPLATPFHEKDIKSKTIAGRQMRYITSRTVMNRLDYVLGPENWWDKYTADEHSVYCELTIRLPDGQVLTKCDAGGYAGMQDPGDDDKSGYADAFKRAAVKFGVGRHLYNDGVVSYPKDRPTPAEAPQAQPEAPTPTPEPPAISQPAPDGFWSWLQRRVDEVNNDWAAMCIKEKKPHEILVKHVNEALNGVITTWLEKRMIHPDQINGSRKGTRSTGKMRHTIEVACDDDEQATRDDFESYFTDKWEREVDKLVINMDAQPPGEAPA